MNTDATGHLRAAPTRAVLAGLVMAIFVCVAAIIAARHIDKAAVDVIYSDTWGYVKLIGDLKTGEARFTDFFAAHNQNISPILCLALWASTVFNHFNQKNLCFLGFVFSLFSFAVLVAIAYRQIGTRIVGFAFAVSAIALTVFSLAQWENYLLSINCVFFATITFSLLSIYMMDRYLQGALDRTAVGYLLATILFFELALLSMAGGIVVGFVTAIQAAYGRFALKRGSIWAVALYVAVVLASVAAYVSGLRRTGNTHILLARPVEAVEFFVMGTGNSLVGYVSNQPALWLDFGVGLALIVVYVFVFAIYFRLPQEQRLQTLPLLSLILFGLLEQFLIIRGRLPGGVALAATSRYTTLTLVAPVGALIFIIRSSATQRSAAVISLLLGGAMIFLPIVADHEEMQMAKARRQYLRDLQATLRGGNIQAEDATRLEWPYISDIVDGDAILRRYKLSFYAKQKAP